MQNTCFKNLKYKMKICFCNIWIVLTNHYCEKRLKNIFVLLYLKDQPLKQHWDSMLNCQKCIDTLRRTMMKRVCGRYPFKLSIYISRNRFLNEYFQYNIQQVCAPAANQTLTGINDMKQRFGGSLPPLLNSQRGSECIRHLTDTHACDAVLIAVCIELSFELNITVLSG